jgi:hypothetical protein
MSAVRFVRDGRLLASRARISRRPASSPGLGRGNGAGARGWSGCLAPLKDAWSGMTRFQRWMSGTTRQRDGVLPAWSIACGAVLWSPREPIRNEGPSLWLVSLVRAHGPVVGNLASAAAPMQRPLLAALAGAVLAFRCGLPVISSAAQAGRESPAGSGLVMALNGTSWCAPNSHTRVAVDRMGTVVTKTGKNVFLVFKETAGQLITQIIGWNLQAGIHVHEWAIAHPSVLVACAMWKRLIRRRPASRGSRLAASSVWPACCSDVPWSPFRDRAPVSLRTATPWRRLV